MNLISGMETIKRHPLGKGVAVGAIPIQAIPEAPLVCTSGGWRDGQPYQGAISTGASFQSQAWSNKPS